VILNLKKVAIEKMNNILEFFTQAATYCGFNITGGLF